MPDEVSRILYRVRRREITSPRSRYASTGFHQVTSSNVPVGRYVQRSTSHILNCRFECIGAAMHAHPLFLIPSLFGVLCFPVCSRAAFFYMKPYVLFSGGKEDRYTPAVAIRCYHLPTMYHYRTRRSSNNTVRSVEIALCRTFHSQRMVPSSSSFIAVQYVVTAVEFRLA